MRYVVDCKIYSGKIAFLSQMKKIFSEMYSLNYDSFIDGASGAETATEVEVKNIDCYEDSTNLREIFKIVEKENPNVKFIIS